MIAGVLEDLSSTDRIVSSTADGEGSVERSAEFLCCSHSHIPDFSAEDVTAITRDETGRTSSRLLGRNPLLF